MEELRFDEATHTYYLGDKKLISTTQLLKKYGLSPDYSSVDEETLKKASEKGTLIHSQCEQWAKTGDWDFDYTIEAVEYAKYCMKNAIIITESEKMVNNDIVGGTLDVLCVMDDALCIADIKTTSVVHTNSVAWQLSIYRNLLNRKDIKKGGCFHLRDGECRFVPISLIDWDEVERLFDAERNNTGFELAWNDNEAISKLTELQQTLASIKEQQKKCEAMMDEFKTRCMEEMKQRGLTKFEYIGLDGSKLSLSIVGESKKESVDDKALKLDYPDIYNQYKKETITKSYLKLTFKNA